MGTGQLRGPKRLQKEYERSGKAVSDRTLDRLFLTEAARGVRAQARTGGALCPARRCACSKLIRSEAKQSERRICRILGQHRSTQRQRPGGRKDEERLVSDRIEPARRSGRSGDRRAAGLLSVAGWHVSTGRVEQATEERAAAVEPLSWFAMQTTAGQWLAHACDDGQSIASCLVV